MTQIDKILKMMEISSSCNPKIDQLQQLVDKTTDQEFEEASGKELYVIAATLYFFDDYKRSYRLFTLCYKNESFWTKFAKNAADSLNLNHGEKL